MELKTERLCIRKIDSETAAAFRVSNEQCNDMANYLESLPVEQVAMAMQETESVASYLMLLDAIRNADDTRQYGAFLGDSLIAVAALRCWEAGAPDLEIIVAEQYRGQGYGKEFLSRLLQTVFSEDTVRHIVYRLWRDNISSEHLVLALGGELQPPNCLLEELTIKTYHLMGSHIAEEAKAALQE